MYHQDDEEKKLNEEEQPKDEPADETDADSEPADEDVPETDETSEDAAEDPSDEATEYAPADDKTPSDNGGYSYGYTDPYPPKKGGNNSSGTVIAVLLACIVVFAAVMGVGIWRLSKTASTESTTTAATEAATLGDSSQTATGTQSAEATTAASIEVKLEDVYISPESTVTSNTATEITDMLAKCYASCVQIEIYKNESYAGSGSGVIYTADGYILTNYHVVGSADINGYKILVRLTDGTEYVAEYVCGDLDEDIAVIKIAKTDCTYATIGNSDTSVLGETVYAIGNPNGVGITITSGVLSSKNKSGAVQSSNVTVLMDGMFLFSAPINGGSSGGGLFNAKGELIGIVNSKGYYDKSGNALEGMSQAIPISKVVACVNTLVENDGYVPGKAKLGVVVSSTTIRFTTYSTVITKVIEDSDAANAGLEVGDIIVAIGGRNLWTTANSYGLISDYDALHFLLLEYSVGDSTTITVYRPTTTTSGGRTTTVYNEVTLDVTFTNFNYNEY